MSKVGRPTTSRIAESSLSASSVASAEKFAAMRKAFPKDMNVVSAGGWYKLQTLANDPKKELVDMIITGLKEGRKKVEFQSEDETIEALSILLYGKGKGFEADLVDGDWALVFSRQGTKSPTFQKLVGKTEKAGLTLNTFDIKSMTFSGDVKFLKNKGLVRSTVKVCFSHGGVTPVRKVSFSCMSHTPPHPITKNPRLPPLPFFFLLWGVSMIHFLRIIRNRPRGRLYYDVSGVISSMHILNFGNFLDCHYH